MRNGGALYQTAQRSEPSAKPPEAQKPTAEAVQEPRRETHNPAAAQPLSTADEERAVEQEAPVQKSSAGAFSLAQVEQAWAMVLHAVRQRNPATEGALRSQCKPVEVRDGEIVITFPFPFLREKLVDPGRKGEIQDALSEGLKAKCRVKLVLASEYGPAPTANPTPAPVPVTPESGPGTVEQAKGEELDAEEVAQELTRWAEERGGQVTVVPPDDS